MNKKIFDYKRNKLRVFFGPFCVVTIVVTLVLLMSVIDGISKGEGFKPGMLLFALVVGVVFGVIAGFYTIAKTHDFKFVVTDDSVEVTKDKANATYPIESFVRGKKEVIREGRSYQARYTFVFEDEENEEDYIYIDCERLDGKLFQAVVDEINMRKHNVHGFYPFDEELMLDGKFTSDEKISRGIDFKKLKPMLVVMAIFACFATAVMFTGKVTLYSILGAISSIIAIILTIAIFVADKKFEKIMGVTNAQSIEVGAFDLKINGVSYNINKIRRMALTAPYLIEDAIKERVLVIDMEGEKKPLKFFCGNRILFGDLEDEEYDEDYVALYNSVKNLAGDKFTEDEIK